MGLTLVLLFLVLIVAIIFLIIARIDNRKLRVLMKDLTNRVDLFEDEIIIQGQLSNLGRQTAQLVHELNNPIGAIKSNLQIVSEAQRNEVEAWRAFAEYTSPKLLRLMVKLVYHAYYQHMKGLSSRERRAGEALVKEFFEDDFLVETFCYLKVYDNFDDYAYIYTHNGHVQALNLVVFITERVNSMLLSIDAVNNLERLLHSLKNYSFNGNRGIGDERKELIIENTIEGVLALYHSKLKFIKVHRDYQKLPTILGFPEQLGQVWTNIISNAVYANGGNGNIYIRIRNRTNWAVIEIEDEGGGIAPDMLDRIFEDFATSKPQGEGTGLGLGISKKIVEKHGGSIEALNKGKGAVLRVKVPLL